MADFTVRYYKFDLGEKGSVLVETEEPRKAGGGPVGAANVVEKAKENFESLISQIPAIVEPIAAKLAATLPSTDQVTVELGFKMSGELGLIVAKTQAEANLKVSLVWKKASKK